ncbi:MAG TPA: chemotaxis protein CheW [Azospirillum sp.]|nr:chemotaxis protein CheW [Azospirillum sp.]
MKPPRDIDWAALKRRLAASRAAVEQASAGRGPWAEELLRHRTEELALPPEVEDGAGQVRLLLARGVVERYALPIAEVGRTQPVGRWTPVPGAPAHLLGLINIGGRVLRLFDVDRLCGASAGIGAGIDDGAGGHAVVLRRALRAPLALRFRVVEAVEDRPAGTLTDAAPARYVNALTGDRIAVLDVPAIVNDLDGSPHR